MRTSRKREVCVLAFIRLLPASPLCVAATNERGLAQLGGARNRLLVFLAISVAEMFGGGRFSVSAIFSKGEGD